MKDWIDRGHENESCLEIYGTLGPSCHEKELLKKMLRAGMTGVRLNLSHGPITLFTDWLHAWQQAQEETGMRGDLLIDLQGREIRIGRLQQPVLLEENREVCLQKDIPLDNFIYTQICTGDYLLIDDGKLELAVVDKPICKVLRGGLLNSHKSLKIKNREISLPAVCLEDLENLKMAKNAGVTGVMVPFVQAAHDLAAVQRVLQELDFAPRVFAKIENRIGTQNLESFVPYCDQVVIARGDLGTAVGLVSLPAVQLDLETRCKNAGIPYMVVTEMLDSMRSQPVCTRAEAMDVFHAVYNGAASIMLTGETASGSYPLEAMEMFCRLAESAQKSRNR